MKTGLRYLVAATLFAAAQIAAASDLAGAFSQGQAMGTAGISSAQSNITTGQGAGVVPNYTSSATESGYFSGGQGSLFGPATGKVSGCATGPKNPDPYKQQECDAVNFLAKNPTQRLQFAITKNDPLIAGARSIVANPAALVGSMNGSYSACSTQTVNQPAQYTTEVCNEYIPLDRQTCSIGQNVQVDADANYQCNKTVQAYEQNTCGKWMNASVTNNCSSQWVSRTFGPPTGPTGHPLSTYDDLRYGAGSVCSVVWPGSSPVSASCYPRPLWSEDGYQISLHGGCDHLHNGGWFYASSCYDQGWCNGDGVASITCQQLQTVCSPVVTITQVNGCSTLEARAQ